MWPLLLASLAFAEPPPVSGSLLGIAVILPDSALALGIGRLDVGALHFEARYNYEAMKTASLWVGGNIHAGEEVKLDLTLMIGGAFGADSAILPGYLFNLGWKFIGVYSEGEFVLEWGEDNQGRFYSWNELNFFPFDGLRLGIAVARMRSYDTGLDIDRGVFVGASVWHLGVSLYVMNFPWTEPTFNISLFLWF